MKANQAEYSTRRICDLLGVSPSGYYAWLGRSLSRRAVQDRELTDQITDIWRRSRRSYGAPRIHAELADTGIRVGRKRVARLMKTAGIQGITRRRRYRTSNHDHNEQTRPPDLVQRRFTAKGPDQLWVADITEIPTGEGPLHLACVQDVWSRRIIGWALETHERSELVTAALDMAITQRSPKGVVHHSDQGSQYTSVAFGMHCHRNGIIPSMGSVGDCYDNALAESFFATLECELLDQTSFPTRRQAQHEVFTWIEGWYNPHRRHSSLGQISPAEHERRHQPTNT